MVLSNLSRCWSIVFIFLLPLGACNGPEEKQHSQSSEAAGSFTLDELQRRTFNYFWDLADSTNYQIPDRWPKRTFSSVAATGFGLAAYIVGVENQYVERGEAAQRVLNTLKVLYNLPQGKDESGMGGYKGFFYHFLTYQNATRYKNVELSSIDTGLLMAGVLGVQSFFDQDNELENQIRQLAEDLYRRVEWDWMVSEEGLMCMGWKPESGKLKHSYKGYSEAMILYILALGSPTHAVEAKIWDNWTSTYPWETFQSETFVNYSPLFTHQYAHMFIDFRDIKDEYMAEKGIDYFENSRRATLANKKYCLENPVNAVGYGEHCWGLTACDGPGYQEATIAGKSWTFHGYTARGASSVYTRDDGTIAPTAAGGSVPFAPEICIAALRYMWETYYEDLVGDYGFKDAFNLTWVDAGTGESGWFDNDYLGIDQGPILIQIENYRSGIVWEAMKKNPYIRQGLKKAGFKGGWLENFE